MTLNELALSLTRTWSGDTSEGVWKQIQEVMQAVSRRDAAAARGLMARLPEELDEVETFAVQLMRLRIACMEGNLEDAAVAARNVEDHICASEPVGRAIAAHRLGIFERLRDRLEQALSYQIEAVSLFTSLGWNLESALCTAEVAAIQISKGDVAGGTYSYLSILDVMQQEATPTQFAATIVNLGGALQRSGNLEDAEERYLQALDLPPFNRAGNERATVFQSLAVIAKLRGRYRESADHYHEALRCVQGHTVATARVRILCGLADLSLRQNDLVEAERCLALVTAEDLDQLTAVVRINVNTVTAQVLVHKGRWSEARSHLDAARALARDLGLMEERYELLRDALQWVKDDRTRAELMEEFYRVAEDRLKAVTVSVQSIVQLRSRYEQERAQREIERQHELTRVIMDTQSETMHAVGRDVHDSLGQDLTVITKLIGRLEQDQLSVDDRAKLLQTLKDVAVRSSSDVRRISHLLAAHDITGEALATAIDHLRSEIAVSTPTLSLETTVSGNVHRIDDHTARTLYRMTQTLMQNVLRHANATSCSIQLIADDQGVRLCVEDNGIGFDHTRITRGVGMRELEARAQLCGGTVHIDSKPGHGTFVAVAINA